MASKLTAYVLPPEASSVADVQTFPGLPGRFFPGEPVALQNMGGIEEHEVDAIIEEAGLPLQKTQVSEAHVRDFDPGDNFAASGEAEPPPPEPVVEESAPVEEPE